MNYTKGPWLINYKGSIGHIKSVHGEAKPHITPTPTVCRVDLYAKACISEDEQKSNSNLIAAAPDLYEALKVVTKSETITPEMWNQIHCALMKAEGK